MALSLLFRQRMVPSEHVGFTYFLLSTLLFSTRRSSTWARYLPSVSSSMAKRTSLLPASPASFSTSSQIDEYVGILKKLLKPVKNPSRHIATTEIFHHRKQFFFDLYREMQLHQDCKVIHVAGTKGKGSTCEYLASSLTAAGYRVGVFTSPHLHTARERIKIGKNLITMEDLLLYGHEALARLEQHSWAVFFDYFLTIALLYFGRQRSGEKLDFLVLECGVGGRYDSTNFFADVVDPTSHTGVITSISYDHQAILGETLPEIAWQKAGIMRPGCKVFATDQQEPEVLEIFRKEAETVKAELVVVPIDRHLLPKKGLSYDHRAQLQNCMLADAVLSQWQVSAREGVSTFYWPCRMETFLCKQKPSWGSIVDSNAKSSSVNTSAQDSAAAQLIVLDGSHNGDSVRIFLQSLQEKYPSHQRLIVFGAGMEKSVDMMMDELFRHADRVVFVQSQHFKSYTEAQLLTKIPTYLKETKEKEALAETDIGKKLIYLPQLENTTGGTVANRLVHCVRMFRNAAQPTVIGVCGSLFVASDAREALYR